MSAIRTGAFSAAATSATDRIHADSGGEATPSSGDHEPRLYQVDPLLGSLILDEGYDVHTVERRVYLDIIEHLAE